MGFDYIGKGEFARLLGVSPRTLDRWHAAGSGPPRAKAGKKVLYRKTAIKAWLRAKENHATQ